MRLPAVGTRVSVRYRRPPGEVPPLTDAVGVLLAVDPLVRLQTKTGDVVEFAPADVVTVRRLTDVPVRNSQIRAVEHAAALAWPGVEQQWLDGWLLRAGHGSTRRANSAVPLDFSANAAAIPAIVDWYTERGLPPLLAVPDRLLRLPDDTPTEIETRMLVRDLANVSAPGDVTLQAQPSDEWLACYAREVPRDVLTSVVDGELAFGMRAGVAVGRAAVTPAPDGERWVGLSAVRVTEGHRRQGHARALCAALLAWGAQRGATRGYVQVADDAAALDLYQSLGFTPQHRCRYIRVHS
ncbi:N-acetylglutamate synthase, CG3035 family [Mycobacterium shimoidei]|uniref:N-acetylglutamate synthase, CG3035 family n=1 Tax=Mycobacterium shimoidei TaxID=29313 RepID=UPI000DE98C01|nr:GNAT family N-acetyltransferase [Mycobacterium shimoidei]